MCGVELSSSVNIVFIAFYRPLGFLNNDFLNRLNVLLDLLCKEPKLVVIGGGINI